MTDEEKNEGLTEYAFKQLADDFQEQFNNKEKELEKCKEEFITASKAVFVGYSVLRMIDNYLDNIDVDEVEDLLWVKNTVEIGREELSRTIGELIEGD